ncbi:MAG: hypothetical protein QXP84_03110 [Candidatus Korarchaeum sp.]
MYKLIYFFGPDGTGKTTHANLIADYLRLRGFKVWRSRIKYHHTFAYVLLKLMNFCGYNVNIISYYGFPKELAHKINSIWKIIEFFSLLLAIFYRIYLPMLLGYIVVCDRYVLDSIATLSYFLKDQRFSLSIFARILVELIPKNSLLVFFDAEIDVIIIRKLDEPLNAKLIMYYKRIYLMLLKMYNLKVEKIDTTGIHTWRVHEEVTTLIRKISHI